MNIGKHKIELVIFDMDGLMFDTENLAFIYWKEAGKKFNCNINYKIFEKTIGLTLTETEEAFKEYFGADFPFEEIKNEELRLTEDHIKSKGVPLKKGLFKLLEYIRGIRLKMALATSTDKDRMETLLNLSKTKKYFDVFTSGDEIINGKPDPEVFLKTSRKTDCPPEKCIVLEDSKNGIIAAYKARMLPVMIPDISDPGKDIEIMLFKRFNSLIEVRDYFKHNLRP